MKPIQLSVVDEVTEGPFNGLTSSNASEDVHVHAYAENYCYDAHTSRINLLQSLPLS